MTPDEIYVFSIILCDNDIDRDNEAFSINALKILSNMFIGKTGIFDHNPIGSNQVARIFDTHLISDKNKLTKNGDIYHFIKADVYMLKTNSNKDLILEIEGGIKKEVSVGCSVESVSCSICGQNLKLNSCNHLPGNSYNNKICYKILDNPIDAYEWSFVAIPSQVNAGVIKNYNKNYKHFLNGNTPSDFIDLFKSFNKNSITLSKSQLDFIINYIKNLEEKSSISNTFIDDLKHEIINLNFLTGEKIKSNVLKNVIDKMSISELKEFKSSYSHQLDINNNTNLSDLFVNEDLNIQKNNQFKF